MSHVFRGIMLTCRITPEVTIKQGSTKYHKLDNVETPYTLLLYSINGVYRGLHYFHIIALKHRLWTLVKCTASIHNLLFEQK